MNRRKFIGSAACALALAGGLVAVDGTAIAAPGERVPAGFTSTFNGSKAGWQNVVGNWSLKPGNLYNRGIAGVRTSTKHTNVYSDVYYKVVMRRRGNSTGVAANAIVINGNPNRRDALGNWKPSYMFQYANTGYVSVWRENTAAGETPLMNWTASSVPNRTGYNTLEVWSYSDGLLDYHLNGVHMWSGYDTTVSFGQVGVSIYTEPGKMSETFIDHATLIDNIGRQARHDHPIAPAGKSVPGGSINMAPSS